MGGVVTHPTADPVAFFGNGELTFAFFFCYVFDLYQKSGSLIRLGGIFIVCLTF